MSKTLLFVWTYSFILCPNCETDIEKFASERKQTLRNAKSSKSKSSKSKAFKRSIFVKINNSKSSTFSTLAGVPQGSVIAPILFLVFVSGIPEIPAQISQFADNFALYYRSRSCRIIQEKLQYSIDKLIKWCEKLKIRINPGKTNFMLSKNPSKKFPV